MLGSEISMIKAVTNEVKRKCRAEVKDSSKLVARFLGIADSFKSKKCT